MLDRYSKFQLQASHRRELLTDRQDHGVRKTEPYDGFEDRPGLGSDLLWLLLYVHRYRRLVVTLSVAGLFCAFAVTAMQTPTYTATARLEVLVPSARVFQDIGIVPETSDMRTFLTAREKLRSRALAQRVVLVLGLAQRPEFFSPAPDFALAKASGGWSALERNSLAMERLADDLSIDLVPNTSLLSIAFRDRDPVLAAEIANQVARSFIDQRIDHASATSESARRFIDGQALRAKEKLQASEEALVRYSRENSITFTGDERSLISANIETMNAALATAVQERLAFGRLVAQIDAGQGGSLEQVLANEGLQALRGRIAELSGEYQQKLGLFKPAFPEMIQLTARVAELRRQLDAGIAAISDSIRLKHAETIGKENNLRQELAALEKAQLDFSDKMIRYTILKREVDSDRSQYDSLAAKLQDAGLSSELRTASAAIVDEATVPTQPFSPRLSLNMALGLILSLGLAATVASLLELNDNTFASAGQVEAELGLPVLGILPMIGEHDFAGAVENPGSALSEAYRALRTSLQFSSTEGVPRILLVTSAEPSEGKTTTSFKLGRDFAALGARVLLVDGDMRNPGVHRLFGLDSAPGLSNLLTNTVPPGEFPCLFHSTGIDDLYVLTSGTAPPNPADLLASPKMEQVVGSVYHRFDVIIIDAPPIIGLADAPHLSRIADATLFVVSARQVTRRSVLAALRRIRALDSVVSGVALTKVRPDMSEGYGVAGYYGLSAAEGRSTPRDAWHPLRALIDIIKSTTARRLGRTKHV